MLGEISGMSPSNAKRSQCQEEGGCGDDEFEVLSLLEGVCLTQQCAWRKQTRHLHCAWPTRGSGGRAGAAACSWQASVPGEFVGSLGTAPMGE